MRRVNAQSAPRFRRTYLRPDPDAAFGRAAFPYSGLSRRPPCADAGSCFAIGALLTAPCVVAVQTALGQNVVPVPLTTEAEADCTFDRGIHRGFAVLGTTHDSDA